jgi:hypothetical protein
MLVGLKQDKEEHACWAETRQRRACVGLKQDKEEHARWAEARQRRTCLLG